MSSTAQPNVLWLIADQWRAQATGYGGDTNARTPRLDRLAAQGANFREAVSAHPLCVPFRGSLLTGRHAHASGVPGFYTQLPPDRPTIAHDVREQGYETAWFGKWHLYDHRPRLDDVEPGWSARITIPAEHRGGFEHWEAFENGCINNDPWLHTDEDPIPRRRAGYQPDVLADALLDWLGSRDDRTPFLAAWSVEPPHDPYDDAPPAYRARYDPARVELRPNVPRGEPVESRARRDLAGHYAHIEATDAVVGRILDYLDEHGLAGDTIIVFMSDHGELLGSHGMWMKTRPFEEAVRIPLLMRWPGHIPPGVVSDVLISEIDIWPTVSGLAGLRPPADVHGQDLSQAALGESESGPEAVLLQHVEGLGHVNGTRLPWRAVRTHDLLFGCTPGQEEWLYDLAHDPYQLSNLALVGGGRPLRERGRRELQRLLDRYGDPFVLPPPSEADVPPPQPSFGRVS